jgi:hypothetical protein
MVFEARVRMLEGLAQDYMASKPFSSFIMTEDPFDERLVEAVRDVEGVAE